MKKQVFLLAAFLFLLASCSIQKRHYFKGFYIARKGSNNLPTHTEPVTLKSYYPENTEKKPAQPVNEPTATASKNNTPAGPIASQSLPTLRDHFAEGCDTLVLVNGKKIAGKITEVNSLTVKVKACTGNSPTISEIPKTQIAELKFANGTSEKIDQAEVKRSRDQASSGNKGLMYSLNALLLALGGYASILLILVSWNAYLTIIPMLFLAGAVYFLIRAFKFFKTENTFKGLWLTILAMIVALPLTLLCIGAITDILS